MRADVRYALSQLDVYFCALSLMAGAFRMSNGRPAAVNRPWDPWPSTLAGALPLWTVSR